MRGDNAIARAVTTGRHARVSAPNTETVGSDGASRAASHGGFDEDRATVHATLMRIVS